MHIALFNDEISLEKEISDKSIVLFKDGLEKLWYTYKVINRPSMKDYFLKNYKKFDLWIPIIHWWYGEWWQITAMLELLWIPYLFANHDTHSLCFNKYLTNLVAQDLEIQIPKTYYILDPKELKNIDFAWPYFVKPNTSWSSIDCGKFETIHKAKKLIEKICKYDSVCIQEVIKWREFTVSISGDYNNPTILWIMEIITQREFFDFDAKYKRDKTKEIFPKLPKKLKTQLEEFSKKLYKKLKIKDLARIDYLYSNDKLYFLEINTIPWMTSMSFFPQCIKHYGYQWFEIFLKEIIEKNSL
jgi:D-alanine-D-alanine ligase